MQSTQRTRLILSTLARHADGVGVNQLAADIGLPPSSLHRALRSLLEHEWVWQDPATRKYSLGVGLLELSSPLIKTALQRLDQRAHRLLAEVSQRTRADAFLAVLVQDKVLHLESVGAMDNYGTQVHLTVHSAERVPLHCGASAKAILAYMPSRHLLRTIERYPLKPYTAKTIVSLEQYLSHLAVVRSQGYALCNEEVQLGVTAVAVPLFDQDGTPYASLGVCTSSERFEGPFRDSVTRYLQDSVSAFSHT